MFYIHGVSHKHVREEAQCKTQLDSASNMPASENTKAHHANCTGDHLLHARCEELKLGFKRCCKVVEKFNNRGMKKFSLQFFFLLRRYIA